ncbi:MAG: DNA mismatch endonuclease Vsr, partial [Deltaproteobacteria bacterium]|nr:DNA mismatch endonuclease Vsr [Deltaproteobacteria bacterium]
MVFDSTPEIVLLEIINRQFFTAEDGNRILYSASALCHHIDEHLNTSISSYQDRCKSGQSVAGQRPFFPKVSAKFGLKKNSAPAGLLSIRPCRCGKRGIMKACSQPRSSEEISNIMRRVRSRNTTPELAFRQALWAKGLRYKLHHGELPGKPDIVFPAKRLAVFVDGDYWHGGQSVRRNLASLEEQFSKSQSISYWLEKIRGNMNRDCVSTARLLASGWRVLRFWASEIEKNLDRCVEMTLAAARNEIPPTPLAHLPYKTFAEFFAGIGLVRMALERQGWTVAYANDVDPKKKEMYDTHFQEESLFHLGDIHHIRSDEIPCVTLATASFPCNDLSVAGARRGLKGKQSSAFWGLVSAIEGMGGRRPPLILLENVTGFLTSHKGRDLSEAMLALNRLGYSIDAFVLDAAQFVPQSRERLFVVAVLNDGYQAPGMLDAMSLQEDQLRPRRLVDFIKKHPEIRWKIRKLPKPPQKRASLPDVLQDLPDESSAWWSRERAEYLLNQMSPRHREVAELMIAGAAWSYGTVFRRI